MRRLSARRQLRRHSSRIEVDGGDGEHVMKRMMATMNLNQTLGMKFVLAVLTASMLAGCTVGPDYKAPETPVPKTYGEAPTTQPAASVAWWTLFNDPMLDRIVNQARAANFDLKAAEAAHPRGTRRARGCRLRLLSPNQRRSELRTSA